MALFFLIGVSSLAQTPDVLRLEYMYMPRNDQEAQLTRLKFVANIPITLGNGDNLVIGSEYNRLNFDVGEARIPEFTGSNIFHVIDLNLAYVYRHGQEWRFIGVLTPRLASTLIDRVGDSDFSINATVGAFRDRQNVEKPTRLVLGIAYNATVALRVPLPIVYFEKRFHRSWTYVVGVPKTAMKFHLDERQIVQLEFSLDGYFVNLQGGLALPNTLTASSVSSSAAIAALGYQYKMAKDLFVYAYGGRTLFQEAVLRDRDRNDIFTLNDGPSLYLRVGARIGL